MEMFYRGYPQALYAVEQPPGLWPYMLYNREEPMQVSVIPEGPRRLQLEQEYFKGLYPLSVRRWQRLVEEESDRYDHPGSPIYDEYPDRESLYRIRDVILRRGEEWEQKDDRIRDLAFVLLLGEIGWRRILRRGSGGI